MVSRCRQIVPGLHQRFVGELGPCQTVYSCVTACDADGDQIGVEFHLPRQCEIREVNGLVELSQSLPNHPKTSGESPGEDRDTNIYSAQHRHDIVEPIAAVDQ